MRITTEFHYDSAHRLPLLPDTHKCSRLHGHTYRLLVTLDGPVGMDGFVIDFADVKAIVEPLIKKLDHHYLNDIPGLDNPTVEVQLGWLWDRIPLTELVELTLFEGLHNSAIYRGPAAVKVTPTATHQQPLFDMKEGNE
jgi:6-pyruvoyltetrahydropterin/6-carboxytetrahydropterin synthase